MAIVDIIAGARPNFVKIAPILSAMQKRWQKSRHKYRLVHTGQHYDENLSDIFFEQLGIPEPHINLHVGSGTQSEQTSEIMLRYERFLSKSPCNFCLVVGDVNSTMASAIVAKKSSAIVGHVEAGIRSGDLSMPEEINRIVTDSISDYFFTTSITANNNLLRNGVKKSQIFFVGNTMIDSLLRNINNFYKPIIWDKYKLKKNKYIVLTLHRPANVDQEKSLKMMLESISKNADNIKLVFPVHPRTRNKLEKIKLNDKNLILSDPLPYFEFNFLVKNSLGVITDSGGITEETTVLGIPCITVRDNTERPETVEIGTNVLVGTNPNKIKPVLKNMISGDWKKGGIPPLWDGNTAKRIVKHFLKIIENI